MAYIELIFDTKLNFKIKKDYPDIFGYDLFLSALPNGLGLRSLSNSR